MIFVTAVGYFILVMRIKDVLQEGVLIRRDIKDEHPPRNYL